MQSNNNMSPVSTAQNEFATSLSLTQSDLSYGIDALNQLDKDVNEAEMDSKEIKNVITAENDVSVLLVNLWFYYQ